MYRPRRNLKALARQFRGSGQWRRQVIATYPDTASIRYLAPPIATIAIALGTLAGITGLITGWPWLYLGLLAPAGYLLGVLAASVPIGRGMGLKSRLLLPVVVATMHLSWGWGFLRSVPRSVRNARVS